MFGLLAGFGLLSALGFSAAIPASPVTVNGTRIEGTIAEEDLPGVESYRGIPFAIPPVGEYRLRPPVPLSLNGSTFNASEYGPSCLQANVLGVLDPESSEDCLTLNVFRPANLTADDDLLPVMFFLPGGGFTGGGSSQLNGAPLMVNRSIERGTPMLMVTANYRLGALGFPQGEEAAAKGALNLGLKDQLVALEWVQENIEYFGGSPKNVTVAGNSAGATSLSYHLLQPTLGNLTIGAIIQSPASFAHPTPSNGNPFWSAWVSGFPSCASSVAENDTITCLQSITNVTEISESAPIPAYSLTFAPVVHSNDSILPDFPSKLMYESGMPVMVGTNLDEGTAFTPSNGTSDDIRPDIIAWASGPNSSNGRTSLESVLDDLLALYPDNPALGSPYGTGNETFGLDPGFKRYAAIVGDLFFTSTARDVLDTSAVCEHPTFGYHFTEHAFAFNFTGLPEGAWGVAHGTEQWALGLIQDSHTPTDEAAKNLTIAMQDYWISFVTSGSPNDDHGMDRPEWLLYDAEEPEVLQLDGKNLTMASGEFRDEAIGIMNENAQLWRR